MEMNHNDSIAVLLEIVIAAREALFDDKHQTAFRLFNGFSEGCPPLAIDLYARTAVIHNYADPPAQGQAAVQTAQQVILAKLPWVYAIVVKVRNGATSQQKRGQLTYGEGPDRRIQEFGVWYAVDLNLNRDSSFYLDTRDLRKWAIANLRDKTVLNTFAYTGSLGVAAQAGGAARVIHLDRNKNFINLAKTSYTLNGFPIHKQDFQTADFFPFISQLKRSGELFDCIFLDPPYFSSTAKGKVDLENDSARLINKVRPLIRNGGWLVAINNALFVSGKDYMQTLTALCADGYLQIETLIPVPEDFTGYPHTRLGGPPVDPAPFNHPTKIAVLKVKRKDKSQEAA